MKRTLLGLLATLAVAALPGLRATAQEINFASHAEIMQVLERQNQRIAELEAAQTHGGGCCDTGCGGCCDTGCCDTGCCDSCCDCCCDPCCRSYGIVGGAEVTFLKAHFTNGTDPNANANANNEPEFDYDAAPRIWLGVQGSDGLGFRARWWEYDHSASAVNGAVTTTRAVDTYVMDLEFTDSTRLGCNWDATFFSGFRYVEFDDQWNTAVNGAVNQRTEFDWSGYGMTLGGELRRCIGNDLAMFANVRTSVILGDQAQYAGANLALVDDELDNVFYIYEAQLGAQWTRCLEDNGYLFARAAVEVQYWDSVTGAVNDGGAEGFGLGGVAFSAGVIR